jgi:hypothetical protein
MKNAIAAAVVASASLAFAGAVLAQAPAPGQHVPPPGVPATAGPEMFKPLPDRKDVVSWKTLSQVELVKVKDRYVPQFADSVAKLDKKEVKLQGFMMPLEMGAKQQHFILSAMPQSCSFCMPGGPEQLVEVRSKTPVAYGFEPIVLSGKLAVLKDDPTGVFYRLTDAVPAK